MQQAQDGGKLIVQTKPKKKKKKKVEESIANADGQPIPIEEEPDIAPTTAVGE